VGCHTGFRHSDWLKEFKAAAINTYLTLGLRLFTGQFGGRRPEEPADSVLQEFYPNLLSCLKRPELRQGRLQLLKVHPVGTAFGANLSSLNFFIFVFCL
jgi:hypothetical protein